MPRVKEIKRSKGRQIKYFKNLKIQCLFYAGNILLLNDR